MIFQETKYNKDFNIIEYTEKDSDGNVITIKKYNNDGLLIYYLIGSDDWELHEYNDYNHQIHYAKSNGYWSKDDYHPPILLDYHRAKGDRLNSVRYFWKKSSEDSSGYAKYFDFFGRLIRLTLDGRVIKLIEYNNEKQTANYITYYSDVNRYTSNIYSHYDDFNPALKAYYDTHPEVHVHNCIHDYLEIDVQPQNDRHPILL